MKDCVKKRKKDFYSFHISKCLNMLFPQFDLKYKIPSIYSCIYNRLNLKNTSDLKMNNFLITPSTVMIMSNINNNKQLNPNTK